MQPQLELRQFEPAYSTQLYLQLSGASFRVIDERLPTTSLGELPQLRLLPSDSSSNSNSYSYNGFTIVSSRIGIERYLRASLCDLDATLNPMERARGVALRALVERLDEVLVMMRYLDDEHFAKVTLPRLRGVIPFPINVVLPHWMRICEVWPRMFEATRSRDEVTEEARRAYEALDLCLHHSASKWLLGTPNPTSVDTLLFGHLMAACVEPIRDTLWSFPNLEAFRKRVFETYFQQSDNEKGLQFYMTNHTSLFSFIGFSSNSLRTIETHRLKEIHLASGRAPPPTPSVYSRQRIHEKIKKEQQQHVPFMKKDSGSSSRDEKELQEGGRNAVIFGIASVVLYAFMTGIVSFEMDGSGDSGAQDATMAIADLYNKNNNSI